MAYRVGDRVRDEDFHLRLAVGVSVLVVVAFGQWAVRGFADYGRAPLQVLVHGVAMLAWLGLLITQTRLAGTGRIALHRRLGWAGVGLAAFIVLIGSSVTIDAVALGRVPPLFTAPYFLMLGLVHLAAFAIVFAAAIALRRETAWHRRLMLVATVTLMEPAFGRLLPAPVLMSAWGGWVEGLLQVAILGVAMVHDLRAQGRVHAALWWGWAAVFGSVALVSALAQTAPVIAWAQALAGAR